MQCVILAGGLGTRLRPVTETIPKGLVLVAGRPFAHHQLEWLAREGVTNVVYSIGHLGEQLREAIGDGGRFGLEVAYVDEGRDLRGTAGALRLALERGVLDESFAVLYGDSYLPIGLDPVREAFRETDLPALLVVYRNDGRYDTSNAVVEGGRVVLYDKRRESGRDDELRWIDCGLSILSRELVEQRVPPGRADLADLYHELSVDGLLAAHEVSERFYEVGSPEGLAELERYLEA